MAKEDIGVLERLCVVAQLINATTKITCIVLDLKGNHILEIPKNMMQKCFCVHLQKPEGTEQCLNSIFKHCKQASDMDDYLIYSCPYGLSNIIFPVRSGGKLVATLKVGPIMTEDPKTMMDLHVSSKAELSREDLDLIEESLAAIPPQDTSFVNSLSRTIALLLDQNASLPHAYEILGECDLNNQVYSKVIDAALSYIATNYMNEISLETVAKNVSLHPARLSRLFSQYTNCNFREYINRLRITKAQQLLLDPYKNIATVCCEVGFSDQSHFDKVFKTIVGETPSHFRKNSLLK